MKKLTIISLIAVASLAASASVFAQAGYSARPGVYDPDNSGTVSATWINKIGLADKGGSSFGLLLVKNAATPEQVAAGAGITGVAGITLTEIGFDIKDGGVCTGGAPRFNVEANDGFHFVGGCGNGTSTPVAGAPGWSRVRFNPYLAGQAFPPLSPNATIVSITLIVDEHTEGTIVDNIDINGVLIDKPGTAK
jgi:hypothetical protein